MTNKGTHRPFPLRLEIGVLRKVNLKNFIEEQLVTATIVNSLHL